MTTTLAIREDQTSLTDAQFDALNIPRNTNPGQVLMFVAACQRTGLDPMTKQIYGIPRGGKLTVQVSIDGLRLIAHREAKRVGDSISYDERLWCGTDGVWRDVWLDKEPPAAAKVTISRTSPNGMRSTFSAVAKTSSYSQTGGMWSSMPDVMVAKVAEALALRQGFPQDTSGLHTTDEMAQADRPASRGTVTKPGQKALPAVTDEQRAEAQANADLLVALCETATSEQQVIKEARRDLFDVEVSDPQNGVITTLRELATEVLKAVKARTAVGA